MATTEREQKLESEVRELARQVEQLRLREAIRDLRHSYWYAILDKDVEALVACFTEDAELDYGFDILLQGRAAIREFFRQLLGNPDLLRQIPSGSNGLIRATGPGSAEGRWLVEVSSMSQGEAPARRLRVQYFEEYRQEEEGWKIARMKNGYLFFEKPPLETEMN